jgi:hypothetical protein
MANQPSGKGGSDERGRIARDDTTRVARYDSQPMVGRRYAELSAEHRFWLRVLPSFLAPEHEPRGLKRALHSALVVPNVIFVSVSAEYQTYLALIFHQSAVARLGHLLCVPTGVALLIATAERMVPSAGIVLGAVFAVWWAAVGALHRRALWSLVNAVVAAALAYVGLLLAARLPFHPAWLMLVVALLQSMSHATETHLPPRFADDTRWVPSLDYFRSEPRPLRMALGVRQMLYGAFDEWWATPRLVHVGTLLLLFRFGYAPELRARLEGYVRDAIASGNPAIDYIGEGGGTYLDPRTLEPRA